MATGRLVVAMTGASGAIYGVRFLQHAAAWFEHIYLLVSAQAVQVANAELDLCLPPSGFGVQDLLGRPCGNVTLLDGKDYFSPPASGSFRHDGMVVVPCSMGTAGRIAHGVSDDLVTRSADVCLKERRPLILVLRETPWSLVHLRNLVQLAEAGAVVMPASPSFYTRPASVPALADTVVARVMQQLGLDQDLVPQWQFPEG